jgi:predicted RNase H-like nuclease (RuvC/YqgF family)
MSCWISIAAVALVLTLTGAYSGTAAAEARRDAGGDAVRKAQLMMRQLMQEKSRLEAENARLSGELEAAREELARQEKDLSRQLQASRASNAKLSDRVRSDHERMQELMDRYNTTLQMLRVEQQNVVLLRNAVEERNQWIDTCKSNNDALFATNMELVEKYRDKGFLKMLSQTDPLTGIGDVQLEVVAEDYRYRLEDLQVTDFDPASGQGESAASVR